MFDLRQLRDPISVRHLNEASSDEPIAALTYWCYTNLGNSFLEQCIQSSLATVSRVQFTMVNNIGDHSVIDLSLKYISKQSFNKVHVISLAIGVVIDRLYCFALKKFRNFIFIFYLQKVCYNLKRFFVKCLVIE